MRGVLTFLVVVAIITLAWAAAATIAWALISGAAAIERNNQTEREPHEC